MVKTKVNSFATKELVEECLSKSKTRGLQYQDTELKTQSYLCHLFPAASRTVFKCRSSTLDIKAHRAYKFKDMQCRRCGNEDETLPHVINCGHNEVLNVDFNVTSEDWDMVAVHRCVRRIDSFIDEFS